LAVEAAVVAVGVGRNSAATTSYVVTFIQREAEYHEAKSIDDFWCRREITRT
jgi:hypothetical protein